MDRERAKELLPIIQAFAEGKEIQQLSNNEKHWLPLIGQNIPYLESGTYRIKPQPEVIYVSMYTDNWNKDIHTASKDEQEQINGNAEYQYINKKFIEVIE